MPTFFLWFFSSRNFVFLCAFFNTFFSFTAYCLPDASLGSLGLNPHEAPNCVWFRRCFVAFIFLYLFGLIFFLCLCFSNGRRQFLQRSCRAHRMCSQPPMNIMFLFQPFLIVYVWSDEFIWLLLLLFPKGVSYSVVQIHRICKVFYVSNIEHASAACVYSTDWLSNRTPSTVWAFPCALWGEAKSSLTPRWFHSIGWFPPRFHHTGLSIGFPRKMSRLCRCAKSKKGKQRRKAASQQTSLAYFFLEMCLFGFCESWPASSIHGWKPIPFWSHASCSWKKSLNDVLLDYLGRRCALI